MRWSRDWKSSKNRGKQRLYRINAPLHIKRKFLAVNLNESLRKQYEKRSIVVRKGDEVVVKRGSSRGQIGEVTKIDLNKVKVFIKGIAKKKVGGTEYQVPFEPSNLQIIKLNIDDAKRMKEIKTKKKTEEKTEKKERKKVKKEVGGKERGK